MNSLVAAGTGNSPDATEACVAAYANYGCAEFEANSPPTECRHPGSGAEGAPCVFAGQCQSDYCAAAVGASCGTCAAPPKAGDSCANLSGCGFGLYCSKTAKLCTALVAQGGACNGDQLCAHALGCMGLTAKADGTCQSVVTTEGAACGGTNPACDRENGLGCTQGKCATAAFVATGEACGAVNTNSFNLCQAGAQCDLAAGTAKGTCAGGAADGAACDNANVSPCMGPARCVGTKQATCQIQTATGCP